jgi:hypothetical protein
MEYQTLEYGKNFSFCFGSNHAIWKLLHEGLRAFLHISGFEELELI